MQHVNQPPQSEQIHTRILKSTTIIGGSSVVNVVFRIVQTKAVAVLIGPSGVGLMGVFNTTLGLAGTLTGMGLATSGVRQIAEVASSGDEARIARMVTVFRRLTLFFGVLGSLLFFASRQLIAKITFGDDEYAAALGWLSIALLLTVVSRSQLTLIRGMQRIGDLARVSVIGIAVGTFLGLPLLYFWGVQGVASYLILNALTTILISWWYARKIPAAKVPVTWRGISDEARALLTLGVVIMATTLTTMATTYLVKIVVTRQLGLGAAGLYEAASILSKVYVGFILVAMEADFFPHLTSVSQDQVRSAQLINAQVEIGLLLAVPGILAVLALGPFLLSLLYSPQFSPAFAILRWQALGTFLRVISWPVAYIMLAKGKGKWFFWSELVTNLVYLSAAAVCVSWWGLPGIGVAFFVMYIFYTGLMTLVARRLIGFRWAKRNLHLARIFLPITLAAILASYLLSPVLSAVIGLTLSLGVGTYTFKSLYGLIGPAAVKSYWQRVMASIGFGASG